MSKKKVKMQRRGGGKKNKGSSRLTAPCAKAPITTAAGPSGTTVRGHTASPAEKEVEMRGQPGGRWSDTGFLIILRSLWGPSDARTLSLCSSWTEMGNKWEYIDRYLDWGQTIHKIQIHVGAVFFFFCCNFAKAQTWGGGGGYTYRTKTLRIINLILIIVLQINLPVYCVCLLENTLEGDLNIAQILNFGRKHTHTHTKSRYHAIVSQSVF